MTREEVWKHVADALRPAFGRLLEVRDVRRVRRVTDDAWAVTVVLAAPSGDVHVADVTVEDTGTITPTLGADDVVEAVRRTDRASHVPKTPDELADFGAEMANAAEDELDPFAEDGEPLSRRVAAALTGQDAEALRHARELLPRRLADHASRGKTLLMMSEVEAKLGEIALARGYLEASAREFADRFDLDALERAAALALSIDPAGFSSSPVRRLLDESRARLNPLASLFDARSFAGLEGAQRDKLLAHTSLKTLGPGEMLVTEGLPSRDVFVVKSGLFGVWLEKPSGGSWLVRCCFPGWLLGESSVLGGPDARCTASLRAERVSEVWRCPGPVVRAIMDADATFARRVAETKQMHRIDSFFSMHETMGQLDVQVRDEMLSCFQRLETFEADTVVLPANEVPTVACLVARGSLALVDDAAPGRPLAVIAADSFYGVRDAIHRIAPSLSAVARAGTTIAFFDGEQLQKLCERSPAHAVAVLERLG